MAKVFICHRSGDQAAAVRLATELRDRGNDVWIDSWKIDIGDSIIGQINDGLSAASFLVFCCPDDPATSRWMDREWMSALARQLDGADMRVLPARLTDGGLMPAILCDLKCADLAASWRDGVDAICRAVGRS